MPFKSLSILRFLQLFKDNKVDFLCFKKRVWFNSRVFQLILLKFFIVLCFYDNMSRLYLGSSSNSQTKLK